MDAFPEAGQPRIQVSILVVDDRLENRLALKGILSEADYRVVEASTGAEALRRLLDEEFAVILLDVVMPKMSGFELASAIKQRERTAATPILFLTGQADDIDLVYKGYRAGAVDYLVKPLTPEMVRAKVAVFAELYRQRKRIEQQGTLLLQAERKEAELRLMELRLAAERRYRILAEAVPQIIWTARPDGTIDYFNQRWFEYTGFSAEQATGLWERSVHPEDLEGCQNRWQETLRSGRMFQAECRLQRAADGAFRWHLCRAVPEVGPDGQIISWLGTFTDIEDQKRANQVLAEFKGTLDAVLDAVMIFEASSWRFLYLNHGATALLGYRQQELFQMRPSDFMTELDDKQFRELLAPLSDGTKSAVTVETRCRRKDGKEIPVELSLQLVHVDGGHIVSIARDVTQRKIAELEREDLYREALAAIRTRDEFLSVAAHELKTPIASLKLQLGLLSRVKENETQNSPFEHVKEKVAILARQVDKLSALVAKLMDVSRITGGQLHLELQEVNLAAIASDVVSRFKEDAKKAGCDIILDAKEPLLGRWDPLRMEQVVTNLLANALKFGVGKPVEVTVTAVEGAVARLVVRDHGIGIAPEDADRIFQRFERTVVARGYAGLGLGLYIVRQIIEAHGGTIRVESQPGSGSTFTVHIPQEPPTRPGPLEQSPE